MYYIANLTVRVVSVFACFLFFVSFLTIFGPGRSFCAHVGVDIRYIGFGNIGRGYSVQKR
ncbi:Uncharacterized protein APZ42_028615 [Daphnia magna]|uniref:Uncharacterized protein n=1 Tax=Daphnia magna TaxID=35525 RepID=A0A164Q7N3_9CRUS|nr:Uncharacterized protein APZ42_028615 [Daphnia magna]